MHVRPKILVVDDDFINLKMIRNALSDEPYDLIEASEGYTALKLVEEVLPDLIILDVMMPGIDGYEVCLRIKAQPTYPFIPIVLVTALDQKNDKIKGLEAGAEDFLSKPFDRYELIARVRTLLKLKKTFDALEDNYKTIQYQLKIARTIQETLVLPEYLKMDNLEFWTYSKPDGEVNGDFLDIRRLKNGKIAVFLADSVGHGVSAALIAFMIRSIYLNLVEQDSPEQMLTQLNQRVCAMLGKNEMGVYCTAVLVVIEADQKSLTYANAGHPAIIFYKGEAVMYSSEQVNGLPIGLLAAAEYASEKVSQVDQAVLYTDGLLDYFEGDEAQVAQWFLKFSQAPDLEKHVQFLKTHHHKNTDDVTYAIIGMSGDDE